MKISRSLIKNPRTYIPGKIKTRTELTKRKDFWTKDKFIRKKDTKMIQVCTLKIPEEMIETGQVSQEVDRRSRQWEKAVSSKETISIMRLLSICHRTNRQ